jgi:hypothetical protein
MKRIVLVAMALISTLSLLSIAVIFGYREFRETHYSDKKTVEVYSAMDLSETPKVGDGCSTFFEYATITKKQYDEKGHSISVLEFENQEGRVFAVAMSYGRMSGAENGNITSAIKVGDQVFVRYSACGSGGYSTVMDLIKRW